MKPVPTFRLRTLSVAVALASAAAVPVVYAQESSVNLETVEVTAESAGLYGYSDAEREPSVGKLDVPLAEQPYSMSVIDQEFIQESGAKNIQDALLYTPGVYAGNFGFDTRGDSAKVRGLDAGRYLDGLRQVYGSYNTVRTNVYALESVEVLRGPSSMLYGQADLGGIINGVLYSDASSHVERLSSAGTSSSSITLHSPGTSSLSPSTAAAAHHRRQHRLG